MAEKNHEPEAAASLMKGKEADGPSLTAKEKDKSNSGQARSLAKLSNDGQEERKKHASDPDDLMDINKAALTIRPTNL